MEELRVYSDPKTFWVEVSPFLKKEEAKNSLCLGLSYTFKSNPTDCIYQSALFQDSKLLASLVISRYRTNHNFLPSPTSDQRVAQRLYNEFKKTNFFVTGIVGEKITADLYKRLFEESGSKIKVNMTQGLYRCSRVRMPDYDSSLHFRIADERDIETVAKWIEDFHYESLPHDPPVVGLDVAKAKIRNQMIFVVEKNGELVSMAAWSRDIETSCSVNLVYTPKPLRKKGYASVGTAKLTQHLLNSGKKETTLYTDMTNTTSNKIYMDVGYEFVCDSVHYGIESR